MAVPARQTVFRDLVQHRLVADLQDPGGLEPIAPHGEVEGLIGQLDEALEAKGYFHPPSRTQATKNTLRTIFTKTGWSSREVKAVRGIIRALVNPPRQRG